MLHFGDMSCGPMKLKLKCLTTMTIFRFEGKRKEGTDIQYKIDSIMI